MSSESEYVDDAAMAAMGSTSATGIDVANAGNVFSFLPEDIIQDEAINLRPYSVGLESIEELAEAIKQRGQIEPVVVRMDTDGWPHLIAGKRRVTAISLLNAGLEDGEDAYRVQAVVRVPADEADAWGIAWSENKDREGMSDMDVAMNIQHLREMKGWTGKPGTKKVAQFMRVSPAYITTHEKLMELSPEIQKKVHAGLLSADAALKVAGTREDKRDEVTARAEEIAREEAGNSVQHDETSGGAASPGKGGKKKAGKAGKGGKGTVKGRHVVKAKRQVEGAETRPTPRTRAEVIEFFESEIDSPIFGYEDGAVRKWVRYFLAWMKGVGTDRGVVERFKVMVEGSDRGTVSAIQPADVKKKGVAAKAAKVAKKKAAGKAAGKKAVAKTARKSAAKKK